MKKIFFLVLCLSAFQAKICFCDVSDPLDPFDHFNQDDTTESGDPAIDPDKDKTAEQLVDEGGVLLEDERLLDARTKLLKALQKDPKQYRAHMLLSGYYMMHVGHYRLALKYILQAQKLFEEAEGPPPYSGLQEQLTHAQLLYLLSQVRLNLDEYDAALKVLDYYTELGYYASWYPGTRAWVLMKLGRIEDAITVARLGLLAGAEPGRTLNMLGILLSMHGEPAQSLDVFKQAISFELSLGHEGQPATPLNNSGEVLDEIFEEQKAETSWLKATSMPDGCEHILPSLNLVLMYIEQTKYSQAARTLDAFESCIAQYPLRNGEEHIALEHLARGRIDMHTGRINSAIKHLEAALEDRQWFGKIGTSTEDLESGALISLAQALRIKNAILLATQAGSWLDRLNRVRERSENEIRSWWLMRRARNILTEDLSKLEDLRIKNTDSMIEYSTFGDLLEGLSNRTFERRVAREEENDRRAPAVLYYRAYRGQFDAASGENAEALKLLAAVLAEARQPYDAALQAQVTSLILAMHSPGDVRYRQLAAVLYSLSRAKIRNAGLKLPINTVDGDPDIWELVGETAFYPDNSVQQDFSLQYSREKDEHVLQFTSRRGVVGDIRVKGKDLAEVIDQLNEAVFSEEVQRPFGGVGQRASD